MLKFSQIAGNLPTAAHASSAEFSYSGRKWIQGLLGKPVYHIWWIRCQNSPNHRRPDICQGWGLGKWQNNATPPLRISEKFAWNLFLRHVTDHGVVWPWLTLSLHEFRDGLEYRRICQHPASSQRGRRAGLGSLSLHLWVEPPKMGKLLGFWNGRGQS